MNTLPIYAKDMEFLAKSLHLASEQDSGGRVSVVCLVVRGRKIVGHGKNSYKRSGESKNPLYAKAGMHAELDALSQFDVQKATLYIGAVTPRKSMACSRPCRRCETLIRNSRAKYVVFVEMSGQIVKCRRSDLTGAIPFWWDNERNKV
jgi:deoxycytidylate deaminase